MDHSPLPRRRSPAVTSVVTAICLMILLIPSGCRKKRSKEEILGNMSPEAKRLLEPMQSTPLVVEGIELPWLVSADKAGLDPEEEVIGVVVEGEPRAYPLSRMTGTMEHVVNDYVTTETGDPKPFTVTYCDRTECIRVLKPVDDRTAESLGVGTLGLLDGGLALHWQDKQFKQDAEIEELTDLPHERMMWKGWRYKHPHTRVYAGKQWRDTVEPSSSPESERGQQRR